METEMSFGPLTWRNGILTRYDFPGGFFSLYDDENEQPQLHPYAYITDNLGSVRMTVDGVTGATAGRRTPVTDNKVVLESEDFRVSILKKLPVGNGNPNSGNS